MLWKDFLISSFPKRYINDVWEVLNIIEKGENIIQIHNNWIEKISLNWEELLVPWRVYFEIASIENKLFSKSQENIFYCILLRHYNWYVRQKALENLLNSKENFIIPFSIQLLWEYVIEIIEVLEKHIDTNIENYHAFYKENPKNFNLINSRMISYWNEYYRRDYEK